MLVDFAALSALETTSAIAVEKLSTSTESIYKLMFITHSYKKRTLGETLVKGWSTNLSQKEKHCQSRKPIHNKS